MKKLSMLIASISAMVLFAELPVEVKDASSRLPEVMQKPSMFLDLTKDMTFTNKVLFVRITDNAAKTYPGMDEDARSNLMSRLEKYYYIATNTPYLNVPLVITPHQMGLAVKSEMQYTSYTIDGTNVISFQKTDRTNVVYKVNSNHLDFNRPQDADVILIFDEHVHIPAKFKDGRRGDGKILNPEPTPYDGQQF